VCPLITGKESPEVQDNSCIGALKLVEPTGTVAFGLMGENTDRTMKIKVMNIGIFFIVFPSFQGLTHFSPLYIKHLKVHFPQQFIRVLEFSSKNRQIRLSLKTYISLGNIAAS
jgi:hypothetical protein